VQVTGFISYRIYVTGFLSMVTVRVIRVIDRGYKGYR